MCYLNESLNILLCMPSKNNYTCILFIQHFFFLRHLYSVTDFEAINHMYATNLAIVFGPTLLQPTPGPASFATTMSNLGHHQNIVKYLILNYHYLFDVESDETDPLCCKEDEAIEATATPVTTSEAENKAMPTDM